MKITEEILRALQSSIDVIGSQAEFAQRANINITTVSNYLTRKTESIKDETWEKIYPLIKPYLPINIEQKPKTALSKFNKSEFDFASLTSDEKILLEAFNALPRAVRDQKLVEICELAAETVAGKQS